MSLPVWIPGSDPSLNLVRILSFSSFTSRTLYSAFTAVPFRGYKLYVSAHCTLRQLFS